MRLLELSRARRALVAKKSAGRASAAACHQEAPRSDSRVQCVAALALPPMSDSAHPYRALQVVDFGRHGACNERLVPPECSAYAARTSTRAALAKVSALAAVSSILDLCAAASLRLSCREGSRRAAGHYHLHPRMCRLRSPLNQGCVPSPPLGTHFTPSNGVSTRSFHEKTRHSSCRSAEWAQIFFS